MALHCVVTSQSVVWCCRRVVASGPRWRWHGTVRRTLVERGASAAAVGAPVSRVAPPPAAPPPARRAPPPATPRLGCRPTNHRHHQLVATPRDALQLADNNATLRPNSTQSHSHNIGLLLDSHSQRTKIL